MRHKQGVELERRLSLHDLIPSKDGDVVGCDRADDLRDRTEKRVAGKEMEVVSWVPDNFLKKFVEDGP